MMRNENLGNGREESVTKKSTTTRQRKRRGRKTHLLNRLVRLIKLLHRIQHIALPNVPLHERRIDLDTFLGVLQPLGEREELGVGLRAVRVAASVGRVALDGFGVVLDGRGEVAGLKKAVEERGRGRGGRGGRGRRGGGSEHEEERS